MPENNKSNEEMEFKNIKYVIQDKKYRFLTWFDMATGNYLRSNVFGKDGMQTDQMYSEKTECRRMKSRSWLRFRI